MTYAERSCQAYICIFPFTPFETSSKAGKFELTETSEMLLTYMTPSCVGLITETTSWHEMHFKAKNGVCSLLSHFFRRSSESTLKMIFYHRGRQCRQTKMLLNEALLIHPTVFFFCFFVSFLSLRVMMNLVFPSLPSLKHFLLSLQ